MDRNYGRGNQKSHARSVQFLRRKISNFRLADTTILGDAFKDHNIEVKKNLQFFLRKASQPVCLVMKISK